MHEGCGTLWAHHIPVEDHTSMAKRTTQIEYDRLKTRREEAGTDMGVQGEKRSRKISF